MRGLLAGLFLWVVTASSSAGAEAQDLMWIQIASRPTAVQAIVFARPYADTFPGARVFRTSSGWYAIVIGEAQPDRIKGLLARLKQRGAIPDDSVGTSGEDFKTAVWPVTEGGSLFDDGTVSQAEIAYWETARKSNKVEMVQSYLDTYPDGHFRKLAEIEIARLREASAKPGNAGRNEYNDYVLDYVCYMFKDC